MKYFPDYMQTQRAIQRRLRLTRIIQDLIWFAIVAVTAWMIGYLSR